MHCCENDLPTIRQWCTDFEFSTRKCREIKHFLQLYAKLGNMLGLCRTENLISFGPLELRSMDPWIALIHEKSFACHRVSFFLSMIGIY